MVEANHPLISLIINSLVYDQLLSSDQPILALAVNLTFKDLLSYSLLFKKYKC